MQCRKLPATIEMTMTLLLIEQSSSGGVSARTALTMVATSSLRAPAKLPTCLHRFDALRRNPYVWNNRPNYL